MSNHVVVLGPGRCGSSAFVRFLYHLGHDTGFTLEEVEGDWGRVKGGLEWPIRGKKARHPMPYIIKNPNLGLDLEDRTKKWGWNIEFAYILVRDIDEIVNSRFERTRGINYVASEEEIKELRNFTYVKTGSALLNCVKLGIPYSILEYPKWAIDKEYLRAKLHWATATNQFNKAFERSIDKSKLRTNNTNKGKYNV